MPTPDNVESTGYGNLEGFRGFGSFGGFVGFVS